MKNLALKEDLQITKVNNKFGTVEINLSKQLNFPQGLMGMPKAKRFCLANCPIEKFQAFKLLQSVDDENLVFMVVPHSFFETTLIEEVDILASCADYEIKQSDLLILFLASAKMTDAGKVITLNVRAPLFIDTKNLEAHQVVFLNENYSIQHIL
jgi:flagellar assembly factor FliW